MKLLVLSDLHNEFDVFQPEPTDADIVVLAGDIDLGKRGIEWAAATFTQPVVYVAGNHEFYRHRWDDLLPAMRQASAATKNVHFLEHDTLELSGVRFLGTTLWTDFELFGEALREASIDASLDLMVDYRAIKVVAKSGELRRLTPRDTILRHRQSLAWLTSALKSPCTGPTVVVTHHLPHWGSVSKRWSETLSSAAFASDLSDLISIHQPALWIHGHTHDTRDFEVGATRVVCNPRGYVRAGVAENANFVPGFCVRL